VTKDEPLDVEHVDLGDDPDGDMEGYDGGFTHPEIDPEMTSGIAIVTPAQYIERTPERRAVEVETWGGDVLPPAQAATHATHQPVDEDSLTFTGPDGGKVHVMHPGAEEDCEYCHPQEEGPQGVYTFSTDKAQLVVIAEPLPDAEQQDFLEDHAILRVLANKIFRRAIMAEAKLPEPPNIEDTNVIGDMTNLLDVLNELSDAGEGKDEVSWQVAEWKGTLARWKADWQEMLDRWKALAR
jgi:hypothetical protein